MRFVPLGAGAGFPRYAMEDVQVGDVLVRAGEPVIVAIGAANRDALRFDDAGRCCGSTGRPPSTSASGTACTTASARPWPGWSCRRRCGCCSAELPGLHLAGDVGGRRRCWCAAR